MAGPRRREAPLVGVGDVRLVCQDGRYLLIQGTSAIDVTSVIGPVNYPLGHAVLRVRVAQGKPVALRWQDVTAVEAEDAGELVAP